MAPFWTEKSIGSDPKEELKRRAHDLKNLRCKIVSRVESNSRVQFASNGSKLVPRNLDPRTPSKVGLNHTMDRHATITLQIHGVVI
jgi:hypothetical protein